ncbi:hypothetical protein [Pseudomonas coronafaciens]|uniref:hypothetical protein n=1 Tax=Pseudomonas coronafaciens TaxID=53409 RepID=UPI000E3CA642|nr:hypothetical protein [Pseudomonas coronafaciens]RMV90789.1 hypothetical protein ALP02_200078 [Pseudomonas coronafaciens pv. garcae]
MSNDIAGNTTYHSFGFAKTSIGDMNLHHGLHNELEVRQEQILTAPTADEASKHHLYATGIVRGFEIGGNISPGQAATLIGIFDGAYEQFEATY